jgi:hypothetical protein
VSSKISILRFVVIALELELSKCEAKIKLQSHSSESGEAKISTPDFLTFIQGLF